MVARWEIELREWSRRLLLECEPIAAALDAADGGSEYRNALSAAVRVAADPESLPSARVLSAIRQHYGGSYFRFALEHSLEHRNVLLGERPSADVESRFHRMAHESLDLQRVIDEIVRADEFGKELGLLCFAEQKRMAAKEQVTFYTDAAKQHPLFGFKARRRLDLGSRYDVTDSQGQPIGWFKKHFKASLVSSTWTLGLPDGRELVGHERNAKVAVARRLWEVIPVVGDIPGPFLFHFDFVAPDGSLALSSTKRAGIKDVYRVTLPALADGKPIDWRVGMAMAVALDALQSR